MTVCTVFGEDTKSKNEKKCIEFLKTIEPELCIVKALRAPKTPADNVTPNMGTGNSLDDLRRMMPNKAYASL